MTGPLSQTMRERKRELRRRVLHERDAIPEPVRDAESALVTKRLLDLPELKDARTVAAFSSFGSEVDTAPMIRALHERGVVVLLPFVDGSVLRMAEHRPGDRLVPTSFGAAEPVTRIPADLASIDVVVVPGLAFDRRGNRSGYGRGYYDAFLPSLGPDALRVGIAFALQILDNVPHGAGDEPVDLIVTPAEVIECRPLRARHNH